MLKKEGRRRSKFYAVYNFKRENIIYQIMTQCFYLSHEEIKCLEI